MRLLMIRHGEKQYVAGHDQPDWPLSQQARLDAKRLSAQLATAGFEGGVCLSSSCRHAHETAEILAGTNGPLPEDLTGLTPGTDDKFFSIEAILKEAVDRGIDVASVLLLLLGIEKRLKRAPVELAARQQRDRVVGEQ